MGAALGCDRSSDAELDQLCVHSRRPPLSSHSSCAGAGKLPRELSFSWRTPASHPTHVRAATDHENEESADWNLFRASTKVHSSSRLLSEFYSLVLESDQNAFFMDTRGQRMSGSDAWMELHMIDLYFHDGSPQPPIKILASLHKHMHAHDSFSNMSTSSTLYSESDYWPTMDSFRFSPSEGHAYSHHVSLSDHDHLSLHETSLAGSPQESRAMHRTSHITKDMEKYAMWDGSQSEEYDNIWIATPKESDSLPVSPRSSSLSHPRSSHNATLAS